MMISKKEKKKTLKDSKVCNIAINLLKKKYSYLNIGIFYIMKYSYLNIGILNKMLFLCQDKDKEKTVYI